jgi:Ser/Thr protein kinase RdoA (MazF antagonist)
MPDIQDLVSRLGTECSAERSEDGWHNTTHFYSCQDTEFVVREPKNQDSDLENEHRILRFLEDKEFAPDTIAFENGLHAVERVGDRELGLDEMTEDQLRTWGAILADIHSQDFSDYRESYPEAEILSLEDWWQRKAGGWMEDIGNTPENLLDAYTEVERTLSKMESGRTGLVHADITASTRVSRGGDIYMIDWEFARFTPRPEMWVAQPLAHGKLSSEDFSPATQAYAKESRLSEPMLQDSIQVGERMLSVFAAISLARRYGPKDSRIPEYLGEDF